MLSFTRQSSNHGAMQLVQEELKHLTLLRDNLESLIAQKDQTITELRQQHNELKNCNEQQMLTLQHFYADFLALCEQISCNEACSGLRQLVEKYQAVDLDGPACLETAVDDIVSAFIYIYIKDYLITGRANVIFCAVGLR